MSMAQNVLIAGHSYVSCLQSFMAKTNRQHFKFNAGCTKCYFSCKGGATIPKLGHNGLFDKLIQHCPYLLILEIGTNDLDSTMADAAKLGRDLFHFTFNAVCTVAITLKYDFQINWTNCPFLTYVGVGFFHANKEKVACPHY